MITVENIKKKFGNFTAVDGISFEIKNGDIVGLLGPNGAGKTTTMRILAGFMIPDEGRLDFDGKNYEKNEIEIKSVLGYMPENNPLYKDMLVKEIFDLTYRLNNVPRKLRKERTEKILTSIGLTEYYYRPVGELSKGYKQRVGIAQALLNEPQVLILDEPTEGLDPNQRAEVRNLIKEIGKNRTVIISTHVMQEVEAMCNRIIIMNKGKIIADGSKEEILSKKNGGNKEIILEISGKDLLPTIQKFKNVQSVKESKNSARSVFNIELKPNSGDEIFEEISKLVAKNSHTIFRLETKSQSLEDIFHDLTK